MLGTKNILPCEVQTSQTSLKVGSRTSSEVGGSNYERSCVELQAKLGRSSSKVGSKFEQSWVEVRAKLGQSSSEVESKFEQSTRGLEEGPSHPCAQVGK